MDPISLVDALTLDYIICLLMLIFYSGIMEKIINKKSFYFL
jgi:hypothetical protein